MDRRALQTVAVALVGVLALSLSAATLTSTVKPDRDGFGLGGGGGAEEPGIVPPPEPPPTGDPLRLPIPPELIAVLIVLGAIATVAYLLVHLREATQVLVGAAVVVGFVVLLAWLLSELFPVGSPTIGSLEGFLVGGAEGDLLGSGSPVPPSVVVLLIAGTVVLGTFLAIRGTGSDGDGASTAADEATDPAVAEAVGRAAGRVADRIDADDDTDVENEVYRAWREMTALLDVPDPETTTPGEFAAAAVEAGIERRDVGELTRLFEDVRYGEAEPTRDREARARDVFRRIEAAYAPDER